MIKRLFKRFLFYLLLLFPKMYKKIQEVDYESATAALESEWKRKKAIVSCNNKIEYGYDLQIVVPIYNSDRYLSQCLDSIFNQSTKFRYFVVLVDDGSNDNSRNIAQKYLVNDNCILIEKENGGAASARNKGIEHIYGKYLTFIDSDDIISNKFVDIMLNQLIKKDADIVVTPLKHFSNNMNSFPKNEKVLFSKIESSNLQGYACGYICKSLIFEHLCFPENYWFEDTLNIFTVFTKCKKAYISNKSLYFYRQNLHGSSSVAKANLQSIETIYLTEFFASNNFLISSSKKTNTKIVLRQYVCDINRISSLQIEIQKYAFMILKHNCIQLLKNGLVKKKLLFRMLTNNLFNMATTYCKLH